MTSATNDRCLYCREKYDDQRRRSREHVFPDACGGHVTVAACKNCNDRIGREIEGPFVNSGWFAMHNAERPILGTIPSGVGDQTTQIMRSLDGHIERITPVVRESNEELQVAGDPTMVRKIAVGKGADPEVVDGAIERALDVVAQQIAPMIDASFSIDLKNHVAMSAKCVLAAMTWLDPSFVTSAQADDLRAVLADPEACLGAAATIQYGAAEAVGDVIERAVGPAGAQVPSLTGTARNQIILLNQGDVSGVLVRLSGTPLVVGPLIPRLERFGDGSVVDEIAMVIAESRDQPHRLEVRRLSDEIAAAISSSQ